MLALRGHWASIWRATRLARGAHCLPMGDVMSRCLCAMLQRQSSGMGYTTTFEGRFELNRPLTPEHAAYLKTFSNTRRMRRSLKAEALPDPVRIAAKLPLGGDDAPYFVGGSGLSGQGCDDSVRDYSSPPAGQPGMWCKWAPAEDGCAIVWNGREKFYDYVKWIRYLIRHFLIRWGYVLNGIVRWEGESEGDRGDIVVVDNDVRISMCADTDL